MAPARPVPWASRSASGTDPGSIRIRPPQSLLHDFGGQVLRPFLGGEVGDLSKVDYHPRSWPPSWFVLALAALGLALLSSVRRHRRDLAILTTIGFLPSGVGHGCLAGNCSRRRRTGGGGLRRYRPGALDVAPRGRRARQRFPADRADPRHRGHHPRHRRGGQPPGRRPRLVAGRVRPAKALRE